MCSYQVYLDAQQAFLHLIRSVNKFSHSLCRNDWLTSFCSSVMFLISVTTSSGDAIITHKLNSERYSTSVCPGHILL